MVTVCCVYFWSSSGDTANQFMSDSTSVFLPEQRFIPRSTQELETITRILKLPNNTRHMSACTELLLFLFVVFATFN